MAVTFLHEHGEYHHRAWKCAQVSHSLDVEGNPDLLQFDFEDY